MLHYDRIDVSEGIDINKTNDSHENNVCHYDNFLDEFYLTCACNGCYNFMQNTIDFNEAALFCERIIEFIFGIWEKMKL